MENFDDILDDAKYKRCIIKLKNKEVNIIDEMNPATVQGLIKVLGTLPKPELKEIITIIVDNDRSDSENIITILKSFKTLMVELQSDWDKEYEIEEYKPYTDTFRKIFWTLNSQKILWDLLTEDAQKEQYLKSILQLLKSTENEFISEFEVIFRDDAVILEVITKYKIMNNI